MNSEEFEDEKIKARTFYDKQRSVYNPYLKCEVDFTAEGFHHLQFSSGRERSIQEQLLKFNLLPVGKRKKDGTIMMKVTYFWAFIALIGESKIRTKTILKKTGEGKVIFWSVMKDS